MRYLPTTREPGGKGKRPEVYFRHCNAGGHFPRAQTDDLNETVNYAAVRKTVNAVFTAQKYDLIERAAQVVCDAILENYPKVQSVTVELKKPEAPINAVFDYVSVEMTRSRA